MHGKQDTGREKRIAGYVRVSTESQAHSGRSSLETQEERIRSVASALNGELERVFCDVESGRRDNRPEYQKMLRYVVEQGIDTVLVQYLDRFGRNPKEILSRIWQLQEHGVTVETTDQDIRDELMLLVQAGVAGHESKRISERVRANMRNSAKKGVHGGPPPYGLRPVREIVDGKAVTARWEIVEEEQEVIREMVRLSVEENLGFKAIADTLNSRGMTRGGRPWVTGSIQRILQNPALKGTMVFGRSSKDESLRDDPVEVPGVFPAVLTDAEWDALQLRLAIRRGSPRGSVHRSQYLLSGIARCGHCGGPMTGKSGAKRKDGTPYRSYVCVNSNKTRAKCPFHNSHSAQRLEPAVLRYLEQFSEPERVAALLDESGAKNLTRLEKDLSGEEKHLAALDRDFHQNLDLLKKGVLDEEEFSKANLKRRDERTVAETRLAELRQQVEQVREASQSVTMLPERVKSFTEAFEELDTPRAKAMLQEILKAAYVWTGDRLELEFRQTGTDRPA